MTNLYFLAYLNKGQSIEREKACDRLSFFETLPLENGGGCVLYI